MKRSGLSCFFLLILLAACDTGSQRRFNREALQEEMRNREPKKVTKAQITSQAYRQGELIATEAQEALLATLLEVIEKEGSLPAVPYCALKANSILDSLADKYNTQIRRTSLKPRNPTNTPNQIEKQLLEAYQYNAAHNLPLSDNVQSLNNEYLLYTKPIVINNGLCLKCHGQEAVDIEPETLKKLNQLYPEDMARNYKMGDFRGIWSIRLSQKELVNAL